jgi:hypothetical protein
VNPEQPSVGCIRVNWVAPPNTAASVIRCISRAECAPHLAYSRLFANISSHTPFRTEEYISIPADNSPDNPMAVVCDVSDLDLTWQSHLRAQGESLYTFVNHMYRGMSTRDQRGGAHTRASRWDGRD